MTNLQETVSIYSHKSTKNRQITRITLTSGIQFFVQLKFPGCPFIQMQTQLSATSYRNIRVLEQVKTQ